MAFFCPTDYFTCMVKVMYNLLYYQIVVQLCVTLTDFECEHILKVYGSSNSAASGTSGAESQPESPAGATSSSYNRRRAGNQQQSSSELGKAMALVLSQTNELAHLRRDCIPSTSSSAAAAAAAGSSSSTTASGSGAAPATATSSSSPHEVNLKSMELQLQSLCLPFLRVAALLRQHLYRHEMPEISAPGLEFVRLVYYLELVTDSMDWDCFNASKGLCFIPGTEQTLPQFWCQQLMEVRPPADTVRELVLINQHSLWQQPRLLELPREYERLFTVGFPIPD